MSRIRPTAILVTLLAGVAVWSGGAAAAPGGALGVLPLGSYICELPGNAAGPAGRRQPAEEFRIVFGSNYRTTGGRGIYLLTGERMTFTSGPFKGRAYHRTGRSFLRRILPDGSDGALRCVRQGSGGN